MKLFYKLLFPLKKLQWFLLRPKTFGVKCVLEDDGKILMIRKNFGTDKWTFPGGAVKKGEEPKDAIIREIKEDLGVALTEVRDLGSFKQIVHYRRETMYCFAAPIQSEELDYDREKIKEVKLFGKKDLPELTPISQSVLDLYSE